MYYKSLLIAVLKKFLYPVKVILYLREEEVKRKNRRKYVIKRPAENYDLKARAKKTIFYTIMNTFTDKIKNFLLENFHNKKFKKLKSMAK